ncbi:MAG TPA: hypothetical protein VJU61_11030 [Polyangiaceae bacterium]|nr:hypothetical protein [Polyangiaceae bacterium]
MAFHARAAFFAALTDSATLASLAGPGLRVKANQRLAEKELETLYALLVRLGGTPGA